MSAFLITQGDLGTPSLVGERSILYTVTPEPWERRVKLHDAGTSSDSRRRYDGGEMCAQALAGVKNAGV
eukprot:scaffold144499_cov40-Tisochrysis_lutea.AAC.2